MRNAGLDEAQAGIKIVRRNINNLKYADDTTLMTESKAEDAVSIPESHLYVTTGKTIALTIWTLLVK